MRGKFIVVEGPDGSGKTTLVKGLKKALEEKGFKVQMTREPGGSVIGHDVRSMLFDKTLKLDPITEALLVSADRRSHLQRHIEPSLEEGHWVICDRHVLSTYVYQGMTQPIQDIVNASLTGYSKPDLTLLIVADPDVAIKRLQERGEINHLDALTKEAYLERCGKYAEVLPGMYTQRVNSLIPGPMTKEEVLNWAMLRLELNFGVDDGEGNFVLKPT